MDVPDVVFDATEEACEEAQEWWLFKIILLLFISATLAFRFTSLSLTSILLLFLHFCLLLRNLLPKPLSVCLSILPLCSLDHGIVLTLRFVLAVHKMMHLHQIVDLIFTVV